jgi:hypothetical protein
MSIQLPTVDLTGAIVGQKFTVDFTAFVKFDPQGILRGGLGTLNTPNNSSGVSPNAHLEVFNESGCGLDATMKASGITFYIPAGKWGTANIAPNDSTCELKVRYILPNPPVSLLTPVYYSPGEEIPSGYTLGNSPIGIGGTVQTSSVQTLSNEGGTSGLVIDIGDATFPQLLTIFQDGHALWSVDQSGTKHQAIKINASGTPLQLGQAADITEILGILQPDGNINAPAATDIILNVPTARKVSMQVNAVEQAKVDSTGLTLAAANKFFGNELDSLAATDLLLLAPVGQQVSFNTGGSIHTRIDSTGAIQNNVSINTNLFSFFDNTTNVTLNGPSGHNVQINVNSVTQINVNSSGMNANLNAGGSIAGMTTFSGTGNGTVATGITSPSCIAFDPCTTSGSSQTIGGTVASSSVVTTGAALAWRGLATK